MKNFLEKLISFIVERPEDVRVEEKNEAGLTIYTIFAPPQEIGKIIGKGGKVINSLRILCRLKATKSQERVAIRVEPLQMENGLSRPTSEGEKTGSAAGTAS